MSVVPFSQGKLWHLRCVLHYANKPRWHCQWDSSGPNPEDAVWRRSKEGLIFAEIEGKHLITRELRTFVQCKADVFCNFEWLAAVASPGRVHGAATYQGRNIGLILVTANERCIVFMDGSIKAEQRNDPDNLYHYGRI